jgi:hypothetical protein
MRTGMLWLWVCACAPWSDDDLDGDGVTAAEGDCDDGDPDVHPGADDPLSDGVDRDCDGFDGPPSCPWAGTWVPEKVTCGRGTDATDATDEWREQMGDASLTLSSSDVGCDVQFTAVRDDCVEEQVWSMQPTGGELSLIEFLSVSCEGSCTCDLPSGQTSVRVVEHGTTLSMGPIELPRTPCPVVFELAPL